MATDPCINELIERIIANPALDYRETLPPLFSRADLEGRTVTVWGVNPNWTHSMDRLRQKKAWTLDADLAALCEHAGGIHEATVLIDNAMIAQQVAA